VESHDRQTPPPVDRLRLSDSLPGSPSQIEYAPASKTKSSDIRRVQINALYFAAFGIWSVGLALTGEPVYGTLAALVLFELALAMLRVSSLTGQVVNDQEVSDRLTPILIGLCAAAKCAPPRVVLRSDALRAAAVRKRKGKVDLLVSHPIVGIIDDSQLRALVAHEVIHIVHNDFRYARVRALVALLGGVALGTVTWIAAGYQIKNLPIFLAAFMFGIVLIRVLLSPLNRRCEVRADVEGAALGGSANSLVEVLTITHARSDETRERLHGRPPWRWLMAPLMWRLPTHPRLADRVARLNDLP
jgi:Zn-dependent protease with chaperone function